MGQRKGGQIRLNTPEMVELWAEAYVANGGNALKALETIGRTGTPGGMRARACRLKKLATERGLIKRRLAQVKRAMGVDELLQRLSDQARGEDPVSMALQEIADKADLGLIADAGGYPSLKTAKAKNLLKFVHAVRTGPHGNSIEMESRPDALKALAGIQKGALDSLAKIHGLNGDQENETAKRHRESWLEVLRQTVPTDVLAEMSRRFLASGTIDITAQVVGGNGNGNGHAHS